jgi:bacillopeptidase F
MKSAALPLAFAVSAALVLASFESPADQASRLAGVADPALFRALEPAGPRDEIPVIIGFSSGGTQLAANTLRSRSARRLELLRHLKAVNESSLMPLKSFLSKKSPGPAVSLWIINAVSLRATREALEAMAVLPGVSSIRLDRTISLPREPAGNPFFKPWNLTAVKAVDLWSMGVNGKGVVVAGIDTGVDAKHPDLSGRWRGGFNGWFDAWEEHGTPWDSDGHGTRTMGLILGGSSSGNPIGVAPGASWIAARIYNDAGKTTYTAIHKAFQWVMDPDDDPSTDDAPDIVNNSWGFSDNPGECVTEFQDDIKILKAAGIGVVDSAGNEGPGPYTSTSPANNAGTLSVGSVDELKGLQNTSSRGPSACNGSIFPAIVAPGVNVKTADLTSNGLYPQSFTYVSGTSFAAPHAAGVMALLLNAFPATPVDEIEKTIVDTAADLGNAGPDNDYGHGLVDALAAWRRLDWIVRCSDAGPDACTEDAGTDSGGYADGGGQSPSDGASSPDSGQDHGGGCSAAGADAGGAGLAAGLCGLALGFMLLRRRLQMGR